MECWWLKWVLRTINSRRLLPWTLVLCHRHLLLLEPSSVASYTVTYGSRSSPPWPPSLSMIPHGNLLTWPRRRRPTAVGSCSSRWPPPWPPPPPVPTSTLARVVSGDALWLCALVMLLHLSQFGTTSVGKPNLLHHSQSCACSNEALNLWCFVLLVMLYEPMMLYAAPWSLPLWRFMLPHDACPCDALCAMKYHFL